METSRLETDQLIERYILNQLDDDEASEFEAFFLSNQACLDQLELAEKLYQGLEQLSQVDETTVSHVNGGNTAANDNSWWMKKVPAWSLVAMLMIAVLPTGYLYQKSQVQNVPKGNLSVLNLSVNTNRSGGQENYANRTLEIPRILSVYIDTEMEAFLFPSYIVEFSKESGAGEKLKFSDLTLNEQDMLYADLGSYFEEGQTYIFSIYGESQKRGKSLIKSGSLKTAY